MFDITLTPGEKVMVLRRRSGRTQSQLARETGLSRITINAIETERGYLTPRVTERLSVALDVPPEELL